MRIWFFLLAFLALISLGGHVRAGGEKKSCDRPVQDCLSKMISKLKSTGFIGVELREELVHESLIVSKVIPGSPAESAGILVGDELYALNGLRFSKENDEKMSKVKIPGQAVTCTIKRDGVSRELKLTLVPMPADLMAKYIGEHMMLHAPADQGKVAKK